MERYISGDVVSLLIFAATILIIYTRQCFTYWQNRNTISLKPKMPFGNLENPFTSKKSQGVQYRDIYLRFKELGVKYGGVYSFTSPVFVPVDPEYIKHILTKDFANFHHRGFYSHERIQPMSATLFALDGPKWRRLRSKFSPSFTTGKMKSMVRILCETTRPMTDVLVKSISIGEPVNAKDLGACYVADSIGSCSFGVDCNSFYDRTYLNIVHHAIKEGTSLIKGAFCFSFPELARFLRIVPFPVESEKFFTEIVNQTIEYRVRNDVRRNDFLQLLIDMKGDDVRDLYKSITVDEVVAQTFAWFIGGLHTSSNTMTFCLFELAQNPHIQDKARNEVKMVLDKHNGEVTYQAISDMKYLQQVLDETLRKYPVVPILNRKCTENYQFPESDLVIEKGTLVVIPVYGIHMDPDIYPEPEIFNPDRFSEENKRSRHQYVHIPFGEGPRNCIGFRFGLLQLKVALAVLLNTFSFTLNRKTKLPIEFTTALMLESSEDILLDVSVLNYATNDVQ